ncbi:MAG: hypothetical protein J0I02_08175, partial [Alphaproteobacteria bacterium]|nr:hypothetical protein [Alphaproteobacteria bacterium]
MTIVKIIAFLRVNNADMFRKDARIAGHKGDACTDHRRGFHQRGSSMQPARKNRVSRLPHFAILTTALALPAAAGAQATGGEGGIETIV